MEIRNAVHYDHAEAMTGDQLRRHFVVDRLFEPGALRLVYSHYDRLIVGGITPTRQPLTLGPEQGPIVGAQTLLERRELGLINLGGPGRVVADGEVYALAPQDALYLGRGTREASFESDDPAAPARYYVNACPAHAAFPSRKVARTEAIVQDLGATATANRRTLHQIIHPAVLPTCQLLMGLTRLETGSVWNTMPAHTHERRMEAYLYIDVPADGFVVHLMGRPQATRHLILRNEQVVLSPPWSIHCGAGTAAYAFVWSMAGDNQAFTDMDLIPMDAIA